MADKVKMRATIVFEYEANPHNYPLDNPTPRDMADIDVEDLREDPGLFLSNEDFTVTVDPIS